MSCRRSWSASVALAAAYLAAPATAGARAADSSSHRLVAVVRAPDASPACQEVATRIIAELMASNIPVMALTCGGQDAECVAAPAARVSAVLLVIEINDAPAVEVRAIVPAAASPAPPSSPIRPVHLVSPAADAAPAALAVRAVELLRAIELDASDRPPVRVADANLGERLEAARTSPPAARPAVPAEDTLEQQAKPAPTRRRSFEARLGAAMVGSLAGIGPAVGPALTVGHPVGDHVGLSLFVVGPAVGRHQGNVAGTVALRQELAIAQIELSRAFADRWRATVGFGVGAFHLHVNGQAAMSSFGGPIITMTAPNAHAADGFSVLASWSACVEALLGRDLGVFLDSRLFALSPTPVILLNGSEVGRSGNPGVIVSAGLLLRI